MALSFSPFKNSPVKPNDVLGGIMGAFEDTFETLDIKNPVTPKKILEESGQFIKQAPMEFLNSTAEIVKGVSGVERAQKSSGSQHLEGKKGFTSEGSIDFKSHNARLFIETYKRETAEKKSLKLEDQMKEAIMFQVESMSQDERNRRLKFNIDYSLEHTSDAYHMSELRRSILEEIKSQEEDEMEQSIAESQKTSSLYLRLDANEGQSATSSSAAVNFGG